MQIPDNLLTPNSTLLTPVKFLIGQSIPLIFRSVGSLKSTLKNLISSGELAETLIFSFSLPTLLVGFFLLRPAIKQIREENLRTMRMLLMV
jgi:hypothetical protein